MKAFLYKSIFRITVASSFIFSANSFAGFDFCSGSSAGGGGNNSFQQAILKEAIVGVGSIPVGVENVFIQLTSANDVDIQLFDMSNGKAIVAWSKYPSDYGILFRDAKQSTNYQGMGIEWSGYNGDGTYYGAGNEYIKIAGKVSTPLMMKVYGYDAGYATVNYSWTGGTASGCTVANSGSGNFQQSIANFAIVKVGDIPIGVNNLNIKLVSDVDVDIQLYDSDSGKAIVAWSGDKSQWGVLHDSSKQSANYQGMGVEWSGYSGEGAGKEGHEYIKITGATTRNLTMKAFGYHAGYATVTYSWGSSVSSNANYKAPSTGGIFDYSNPKIPGMGFNLDNVSFTKDGKSYSVVSYHNANNNNDNYIDGIYQCTEIVKRYVDGLYGISSPGNGVDVAANLGKNNPSIFKYFANGSSTLPVVGSVISTPGQNSYGHVAIVKAVQLVDGSTANVQLIEQNISSQYGAIYNRVVFFKRDANGNWSGASRTSSGGANQKVTGWANPL